MDINAISAKLNAIPDPEIPVLTLGDLGVIREIKQRDDQLFVTISPTYTGCPATAMINEMVHSALIDLNIFNAEIVMSISPPWSSDWISDAGRKKLLDYGIAPPNTEQRGRPNSCPQCTSKNVLLLSEFGSTPCQAMWRCNDCHEVFNYFKCI